MKKLAVALGPMLDYVENNYDAQSVELSLSTLITACLPLAAKVGQTAQTQAGTPRQLRLPDSALPSFLHSAHRHY